MKRLLLALVLVVAMATPAYAGITDMPVVGRVVEIGQCIVANSGKLVTSAINHVSDFGMEVIHLVSGCLTGSIDAITPDDCPFDNGGD